ncbi:MAG TPA: NIPSNAP family protein [Anaerolineae bacterium]|nr:NIPSNAP family protein [Anaerolineae bacterium]HQI85525.1 NIPSNAP family protein [Anaerolineae bacterium]
MFFELREYRTKPGQRERWVKFMEEVILPFQISKGMVVVGSFIGTQEDDLYIWIRRFDSEEQREALYAAVYQSDEWQNVIAPQIPEMMDRERMVIRRIAPTEKSVIR